MPEHPSTKPSSWFPCCQFFTLAAEALAISGETALLFSPGDAGTLGMLLVLFSAASGCLPSSVVVRACHSFLLFPANAPDALFARRLLASAEGLYPIHPRGSLLHFLPSLTPALIWLVRDCLSGDPGFYHIPSCWSSRPSLFTQACSRSSLGEGFCVMKRPLHMLRAYMQHTHWLPKSAAKGEVRPEGKHRCHSTISQLSCVCENKGMRRSTASEENGANLLSQNLPGFHGDWP